jgi:hypothetical protein
MVDFAQAHAHQNEASYQRVRKAADDGLITVASG